MVMRSPFQVKKMLRWDGHRLIRAIPNLDRFTSAIRCLTEWAPQLSSRDHLAS